MLKMMVLRMQCDAVSREENKINRLVCGISTTGALRGSGSVSAYCYKCCCMFVHPDN